MSRCPPLSPAALFEPGPKNDPRFKGLMALLAGCGQALVDVRAGQSLHSTAAKNNCLRAAEEALTCGMANYRRVNGMKDAGEGEGHP